MGCVFNLPGFGSRLRRNQNLKIESYLSFMKLSGTKVSASSLTAILRGEAAPDTGQLFM